MGGSDSVLNVWNGWEVELGVLAQKSPVWGFQICGFEVLAQGATELVH